MNISRRASGSGSTINRRSTDKWRNSTNHNTGWQIPGQQDRKAQRVDVPSSPAELAAWLNERHVTARARHCRARGDPIGDAGAVLDQADVDQVNEQRAGFMPDLSADEIERRRMAVNRCPKCNASRVLLDNDDLLRRAIAGASLEDLQVIGDEIRRQVRELAEQLDSKRSARRSGARCASSPSNSRGGRCKTTQHISRRCLICAALNPCRQHSAVAMILDPTGRGNV
jgi:hypothetical protein